MLPVVGLDSRSIVLPLIDSYCIFYTLYIVTPTLNKLNKQTNKHTQPMDPVVIHTLNPK